jgi:transposase
MYTAETYGRVRRAVLVEGKGERAVAQEFGIARETVRKMLRLSFAKMLSGNETRDFEV